MKTFRSLLASKAGSWILGTALLATVLPVVIDFHVLRDAPGVEHGLVQAATSIAVPVGVTRSHPRTPHAESSKTVFVRPCPACLLHTVHRLAPVAPTDGARPTRTGVLATLPLTRAPAGSLSCPSCRGPPLS